MCEIKLKLMMMMMMIGCAGEWKFSKQRNFVFHHANKYANFSHCNFHCPQSIIHIYRLRKRLKFPNTDHCFPYASRFVERHISKQLQSLRSLLSTTVAANQTKWSFICFLWQSWNNRWVTRNIPMNTLPRQCVANALNHLSFLKIV